MPPGTILTSVGLEPVAPSVSARVLFGPKPILDAACLDPVVLFWAPRFVLATPEIGLHAGAIVVAVVGAYHWVGLSPQASRNCLRLKPYAQR